MKTTIKKIAQEAGVSIATVSHVINATRYVSPELVEKIKTVIETSDYKKKIEYGFLANKRSQIAVLVPCFKYYMEITHIISEKFSEAGYVVSVFTTNNDINNEKYLLTTLLSNKSVGGIILVPSANNSQFYKSILNRNIPFVLLERFYEDNRIDSIITDFKSAFYNSTNYLIHCGHNRIGIITENKEFSTSREQLSGYQKALAASNVSYSPQLVLHIDNYHVDNMFRLIKKFYEQERPTAILSGMRWITPGFLRFMDQQELEYPQNISFIGVCHNEWTEIFTPPLTLIEENFIEIGTAAAAKIFEKIKDGARPVVNQRIQANFHLRKSTQTIGRGPFGEEATPIEKLVLTEKEIEKLRSSQFKVGISFHYGNTAWQQLHERGIRDTLEKCGVKILSVTEAHFNPKLQITQLEGLRMQMPDAIIAVPSDDLITAKKFKELAKEVTLIFISNIPRDLTNKDYASCVSVNEQEGGHKAGILLGEYYKNRNNVNVGFITHGASFYGTHIRDRIAEQVIRENYSGINIVSVQHFQTIKRAYNVCKEMISEYPKLKALYVSWDGPALQVIKALKELKRDDIEIFSFDLDYDIALHLAKGDMVKGLVIQRPYTQGTAVGLATAKALLGEKNYKYIGISPYVVKREELPKAWEDVFKASLPKEIDKVFKSKMGF